MYSVNPLLLRDYLCRAIITYIQICTRVTISIPSQVNENVLFVKTNSQNIPLDILNINLTTYVIYDLLNAFKSAMM